MEHAERLNALFAASQAISKENAWFVSADKIWQYRKEPKTGERNEKRLQLFAEGVSL